MVRPGFTDEERRLRRRILEMGINQKRVAEAVGLKLDDVSKVVRGRCKSPHYVAEVYNFLELKMPKEER